MEQSKIKEYSNGEITVVWNPDVCIHSAKCVQNLGKVFNPKARPWINMDAGTSDEIISAVKLCPSGALSIKNAEDETANQSVEEESVPTGTKITVIPNGPFMLEGSCSLIKIDGSEEKSDKLFLCRCGASENKPFCDGKHKKIGFTG